MINSLGMKKYFLKGDIIFILFVLIISLTLIKIDSNKAQFAVVRVDGIEKARFSLSGKEDGVYSFETKYGKNTIEIKDSGARIIETDCPDKLCEKQGFINKSGLKLVCLPHHLVVEILGEDKELDGVTE